MDNQAVEVLHKPWLIMENGRRIYAHVIGLQAFTCPGKPEKPAKVNRNHNN